jgi:hypothetical protein
MVVGSFLTVELLVLVSIRWFRCSPWHEAVSALCGKTRLPRPSFAAHVAWPKGDRVFAASRSLTYGGDVARRRANAVEPIPTILIAVAALASEKIAVRQDVAKRCQ